MDVAEDIPEQVMYSNAYYALKQIDKGAAKGSRWRLQIRSAIERAFGTLGAGLGHAPWLAICLVLLVCGLLAGGLTKARFETDEYELWTETGGRLEEETDYTNDVLGQGSLPSNELLIQVGRRGSSAITVDALDEHLSLVRRISQSVIVTKWGREWQLADLCYNVKPPETVVYPYLDGIFKEMNPCIVLSVLDCFWDGSLVHDRQPYHLKVPLTNYDRNVTWSTLDPHVLLEAMKNASADPVIRESLESAGFDGYVHKRCLHPNDPRCPSTAPNKDSETENIHVKDIEKSLAEGCTGYASTAAIWPSALIVSGEAGSPAVQAIFRLNSEQKVSEMLSEVKSNNPSGLEKQGNFSLKDAAALLKDWRKEFVRVVYDTEDDRTHTVAHAWSTDSAQGVIEQYQDGSVVLLVVGYGLMMVYAGMAFVNLRSITKSRMNVGIVGVLLVVLSCLAGLGFSSLCGLPFNPTTTQVLPFLVLGLGVDDMFVMAHAFFTIFDRAKDRRVPLFEISRESLELVGLSVTLTSLTNSAGFFLAALIPIPAMRHFALQVGICVVFNYFVLLVAFPSYLCIDARRVKLGLCDIFCCGKRMVSICCFREDRFECSSEKPSKQWDAITTANGGVVGNGDSIRGPATMQSKSHGCGRRNNDNFGHWFVRDVYTPILLRPWVKAAVLLIAAALLSCCVYGVTKVENGLDLTEVVPSGTKEHGYVSASLKYFSFFDVYIVQDGNNDFSSLDMQSAMLDFHRQFANIPWIVKRNRTVNGERLVDTVSESFWLEKMIDFYMTLQESYDEEQSGVRTPSFTSILVQISLLPQLGGGKTDLSLATDPSRRLIDNSTGRPLIPPERFYVYLTAWVNVDILYAESTQPSFRPVVPKWQVATPDITPADKMVYAQMPMYASSVKSSANHIELIKQTRDIIEQARSKKISAYPRGTSFTFYEQYIGLQKHLLLAVGLILVACFLATSLLLLSIWSGVIMIFMLGVTAIEVYGFLGLANIQFSAIPCVTVIVSVGATVEFTAPLCLMFVKIAGTRKERVEYALLYRFVPIFNGAVSTFLGFIMLAFTQFEFIIKYFLVIFIALLVVGTFNGLVVLPVLLSLVGPPPQVVPVHHQAEPGNTPNGIHKYECKNESNGSVQLKTIQQIQEDELPVDHDVLRDGTPV